MRYCKRVLSGTFILFIAAFLSVSCNGGVKKEITLPSDQLLGSWFNGQFKQQPALTFNKNGTYFLRFMRSNQQFNGNYHASGNMITMLDFYCGTGVPGVYRFAVKGDSLSFECLDDSKCDRNRFFTQKWKKVK